MPGLRGLNGAGSRAAPRLARYFYKRPAAARPAQVLYKDKQFILFHAIRKFSAETIDLNDAGSRPAKNNFWYETRAFSSAGSRSAPLSALSLRKG